MSQKQRQGLLREIMKGRPSKNEEEVRSRQQAIASLSEWHCYHDSLWCEGLKSNDSRLVSCSLHLADGDLLRTWNFQFGALGDPYSILAHDIRHSATYRQHFGNYRFKEGATTQLSLAPVPQMQFVVEESNVPIQILQSSRETVVLKEDGGRRYHMGDDSSLPRFIPTVWRKTSQTWISEGEIRLTDDRSNLLMTFIPDQEGIVTYTWPMLDSSHQMQLMSNIEKAVPNVLLETKPKHVFLLSSRAGQSKTCSTLVYSFLSDFYTCKPLIASSCASGGEDMVLQYLPEWKLAKEQALGKYGIRHPFVIVENRHNPSLRKAIVRSPTLASECQTLVSGNKDSSSFVLVDVDGDSQGLEPDTMLEVLTVAYQLLHYRYFIDSFRLLETVSHLEAFTRDEWEVLNAISNYEKDSFPETRSIRMLVRILDYQNREVYSFPNAVKEGLLLTAENAMEYYNVENNIPWRFRLVERRGGRSFQRSSESTDLFLSVEEEILMLESLKKREIRWYGYNARREVSTAMINSRLEWLQWKSCRVRKLITSSNSLRIEEIDKIKTTGDWNQAEYERKWEALESEAAANPRQNDEFSQWTPFLNDYGMDEKILSYLKGNVSTTRLQNWIRIHRMKFRAVDRLISAAVNARVFGMKINYPKFDRRSNLYKYEEPQRFTKAKSLPSLSFSSHPDYKQPLPAWPEPLEAHERVRVDSARVLTRRKREPCKYSVSSEPYVHSNGVIRCVN